jgi:APA family basic amino acid/polyamine antiporter
VIGAIVCAYLASPLSGRAGADYRVAGILLVIGVVLWLITYLYNRNVRHEETTLDPTKLKD